MAPPVDYATAQHVIRTLRALELLAEGPHTQASVARALAVHRRTARRLLGRLVAEGYAEMTKRGRYAAYVATPRLAVLGRQVADGLDLVALGHRHLATIGPSSVNDSFIVVQRSDRSSQRAEIPAAGGAPARVEVLPDSAQLHATAAGKVFLSADTTLLSDVLSQELLAFTAQTLIARADLLLELARVRAQGYAIEDREHRADACAVAGGVVNHVGATVACLCATAMPGTDLDALGRRVRSAAQAFSYEIGGSPGQLT